MKPRWYILDDENRPVEVDIRTWGKWFDNVDHRIVGYTQITSDVLVSTVFIGLDHRPVSMFGSSGPPILFETLIFGGDEDGLMQRYASWDDAKTGHDVLVNKMRAKLKVRS